MDKYEFNIKVEQIKKMVARSDYVTAMKIADTIDWRRVRNINILSMAAAIYEKNEEYQEAKDILLLAFERAPIGKRLLYKLAELAAKEGSLREAEDYYREFCDLAPDDPRQYILRYLILDAKGAPAQQLIHTLEQYCNLELDEKWLYELAELYREAGLDDLCIMTCDKIMLMFGLGKYVDKAMELKMQLAPLTKYQMDLVENRDKYEARLKAVEQGYHMGGSGEYEEGTVAEAASYGYQEPSYRARQEAAYTMEPESESRRDAYRDESRSSQEADEEASVNRPQDSYEEQGEHPVREGRQELFEDEEDETPESSRLTIEPEETGEGQGSEPSQWTPQEPVTPSVISDEALKARIHEAEAQANLASEMSRLSEGPSFQPELEMAQTRVLTDIRDIKRGAATPVAFRLMIEAETPEQGLKQAVDALKKIHRETGSKNQAAKITGEKLNLKGVFAVADKLTGKDLIVEQAGVMAESTLQELNQLIARDETGMNVVLIDSADRLQKLYQIYPGFAKQFELTKAQTVEESVSKAEPEKDNRPVRHIELKRENAGRPVPLNDGATPEAPTARPRQMEPQTSAPRDIPERKSQSIGERKPQSMAEPKPQPKPGREPAAQPKPVQIQSRQAAAPSKSALAYKWHGEAPPSAENSGKPGEPEYEDEQEEMDIDEFAKYACKYAGEIDCSISGKSMLALYERIEIMEEDGIPLIKENAEELIEEAADKAEHPSFFKRLTGIFSSKYDKEGLLILKEEHFI